MKTIAVDSLSKSYLVTEKKPGIRASLKHFVARKTSFIRAVDNISFNINEGEIVGFIGSNGAGKTTTLKMLCGLIYPSYGSVSVAGYIPKLREKSFLRKITLVMGQKQQLIWDLPPMDSLRVNAAVYGLTDREFSLRIDELASMLGLNTELSRPVRKLSLGQRMKAELLASLLHRPSVLFLDEPTLGLDINAQLRVREFLSAYNQKYGATILLTSHYMGDITSLCKRVLLIDKGKLFHDGSLSALTEQLSPCRFVQIELAEPVNDISLAKYGEIVHQEGQLVKLLIPRSELTSRITSILSNYQIKDLEVKDPPIEQLIGKLLALGSFND